VPTSMPSPIGPSSEYFRLSDISLARQRESQRSGRVPEVGGFTGQSVSTPSPYIAASSGFENVNALRAAAGAEQLQKLPEGTSRYQPNRPPVGRSEYDDAPPSVQPRGHPTLAPPLTVGQYIKNIVPAVGAMALGALGGGGLPLAIASGLFSSATGSTKAILQKFNTVLGEGQASDQQIQRRRQQEQQQQHRSDVDVGGILRQAPVVTARGEEQTARVTPLPQVVPGTSTTPRRMADAGGAVTPERTPIKPAQVVRVAGQTQRDAIQFGRRGRTRPFVKTGTLGLTELARTRKPKLGGGRGLA
jgi:hypothetical protein